MFLFVLGNEKVEARILFTSVIDLEVQTHKTHK